MLKSGIVRSGTKYSFNICFSNSGHSPAELIGIKSSYRKTCASGVAGQSTSTKAQDLYGVLQSTSTKA